VFLNAPSPCRARLSLAAHRTTHVPHARLARRAARARNNPARPPRAALAHKANTQLAQAKPPTPPRHHALQSALLAAITRRHATKPRSRLARSRTPLTSTPLALALGPARTSTHQHARASAAPRASCRPSHPLVRAHVRPQRTSPQQLLPQPPSSSSLPLMPQQIVAQNQHQPHP
jgi:hypothetical protein